LLVFFICLMFYPYAYLSFQTEHKFYSPDETANFIFTKQFIENGKIYLEENLNPEVNNIILPRSINILENKLVPQSFLGLNLIYGAIGKITGANFIIFLTPIVSLISVLLFYFLIKHVFNRQIAFWSALLLLIHPVFWYSAGKTMLHNNLFIFLIILGFLILFKALNSKKHATPLFVFSAIVLGLSIWVRSSELIWIGIFLLVFYLFNRKKINLKQTSSFIIFFAIMIGILLAINYSVYNNIFSSGYSSFEQIGIEKNLLQKTGDFFAKLFLPFGFNFKYILIHLFEFFVKYIWFLFIPSFLSLIFVLKNKNITGVQKSYTIATGLISVFLIIFYGSYWLWGLSGQPEQPLIAIGSPHLRYWLPMLVLTLPFIVIFFTNILPGVFNFKSNRIKNLLLGLFTIFILIFSINQVFYSQDEGFLKIKQDLLEFKPRLEQVQSLIPSDSVLIVPNWADRIFFPEFAVIHSIEDSNVHSGDIFAKIKDLTALRPVYYYSASSTKDIEDLNENKFKKHDLNLELVQSIYKGESLYTLNKTTEVKKQENKN